MAGILLKNLMGKLSSDKGYLSFKLRQKLIKRVRVIDMYTIAYKARIDVLLRQNFMEKKIYNRTCKRVTKKQLLNCLSTQIKKRSKFFSQYNAKSSSYYPSQKSPL
ncbi:hypothetical protein NEOC65_000789 [Neochlamydia sp. AcF65]|nr:hypothetical protein [Neochlamydia sp. AcF65]MBS4170091.1 hypothetical protein [Neochlamydia sp. AcF95]